MGIADAIAKRIASKPSSTNSDRELGSENKTAIEEGALKPGDHGRRIFAAFNQLRATGADEDAISLEQAVRDCIENMGEDYTNS
jgi:hypothetical protein